MTETLAMNRISKNSLLIPSFKKLIVVEYDKILYIKAMENYTTVFTVDGKSPLVSISFGKLLRRLSDFNFHQCHKSYAVNKKYVLAYHKSGSVELQEQVMVPVSRRKRKEFLSSIMFSKDQL